MVHGDLATCDLISVSTFESAMQERRFGVFFVLCSGREQFLKGISCSTKISFKTEHFERKIVSWTTQEID